MTIPDRYDAYWIPGPDALDMDLGLRLGYQWLDSVPCRGERVVVLYAKKMLNNRPMLARASRYHVVSPRSRDIPYATAGAVLAIWPNADTLEFAQQLALDSALCAIPYTHDVTWWITRSGAVNLADPNSAPATLATVDAAVAKRLDWVLSFGGHNGFVGGDDKETAARELREMLAAGHRPTPQEVEDYARASGETTVEGARRLRSYYEKTLAGRQLRNNLGRAI